MVLATTTTTLQSEVFGMIRAAMRGRRDMEGEALLRAATKAWPFDAGRAGVCLHYECERLARAAEGAIRIAMRGLVAFRVWTEGAPSCPGAMRHGATGWVVTFLLA